MPLTLLSVLALSPLLYLALKVPAPRTSEIARGQLRLAWILGGVAWAFQLWLVAGVAPAVRAIAAGQPLSQWRALTSGIANLVRGIVPCAIAVVAVVLGGIALVVPALVVLVFVSLTGASPQLGGEAPAAVRDSIAIVRANVRTVAIVALAIVALDLAITLATQLAIVPAFAKKTTAAKLLPIRDFVRVVAAALVVMSPLAACALASVATRERSGP